MAALLMAAPASAGVVSSGSSLPEQRKLSSGSGPVCWNSGSPVPSAFGSDVTGASVDPAGGVTTCYQLSFQYDPAATTWRPLLANPCRLEEIGGVADGENRGLFEEDEDGGEDDWFGDKDRSFDDLIIGSVTIGIGGPTVGGTGIVGGTGNTAGGTTVGFGGNTAGGTTVGGFGNTANNSGTTINGAAAIADQGIPQLGAVVEPCVTAPAEGVQATGSEYDRGFTDGWNARDAQDGEEIFEPEDQDEWAIFEEGESPEEGADLPVL